MKHLHGSKELCREIQQSYLSLCAEHPQGKVKVKEIMERAGHSKSTFYLNYENVEALRDELIHDLIDEICTPFSRTQTGGMPAFSEEGFRQILLELVKNRTTVLLLLQQGGREMLRDNLFFFLHRAILLRLTARRRPEQSLYDWASLLCHGVLDLTLEWLVQSGTESAIPKLCKTTEDLLCRLEKS